jgi:hypothetical protein
VHLVDDFDVVLDLASRRRQVPTAKSPPPASAPAASAVDHFQCYQAKIAKGTAPSSVVVTVSDSSGRSPSS